MRAIIQSRKTGEVLLELDGSMMTDAMTVLSFFKVPKEVVESNWGNVWEGILSGDIYKFTPNRDGESCELSVCNESIKWEW